MVLRPSACKRQAFARLGVAAELERWAHGMRTAALIYVLLSFFACNAKKETTDNQIPQTPNGIEMTKQYPSRCATFRMMDNHVVATANDRPALVTLDPWPEMVFLASDGEHIMEEIVAAFAAGYPTGAPKELKATVISVVSQLEKEGLVTLSDKPIHLPSYLKLPLDGQDPDKVREAMLADGFIKK